MSSVPPSTSMDAETFYRHWNLRHMPMEGTTKFRPLPEESGAVASLRAYHKHLHTKAGKQNHNHNGGNK
jgi:hypothetical protein